MNKVIAAAVRASSTGAPSVRTSRYVVNEAMPQITPAGTENRSTRLKKPGLNRCVLGINARKNAGVPIVSQVITVK